MRNVLGLLIVLALLGWLFVAQLIRSPKFQTFLVHTITKAVSSQLNGNISIGSVDIKFFKTLVINQFLIAGKENDTIVYVGKLEADISIFSIKKKKFLLDELLLNNIQVNITRLGKDSLFNYNKLLYVRTKTSSDTVSRPLDWVLSLKEFDLNQAQVYFRDDKNKLAVATKLSELRIDIHSFDLQKLKFNCADVLIDEPMVKVGVLGTTPKDSLPFKLNLPLQLEVENLAIQQGQFMYDHTDFKVKPNVFDPAHISFSKIEAVLQDISLDGENIGVAIKRLSATDKNKFHFAIARTSYKMNNQFLDLGHADISVNSSRLKAGVRLKYKDLDHLDPSDPDFSFNLAIQQGLFFHRDIGYFEKKTDKFHVDQLAIKGKLAGKLKDFTLKDLDLLVNNKIQLKGSLAAVGMPDIKQSVLTTDKIALFAEINEIQNILPKEIVVPELVRNLGFVQFDGSFRGKINDFLTQGVLNTAIGKATANLSLNYTYTDKIPVYKGVVNFDHINLGKLLQDSLLGFASLDLKVDGKGLKFENLNSHIEGQLHHFDFRGYHYAKADIDGQIQYKKFKGLLNINDSNLVGNMNGMVDLSKQIPAYNFTARLEKLNFMPLRLMNKPWTLSAFAKVDFVGSSIDEMIGQMDLDSVKLFDQQKNKNYQIDYLTLSAQKDYDSRTLVVYSDIFQGEVQGKFRFKDLPKVANQYLLSYFTDQPITDDFDKQVNLNFDISLENTKKILPLFLPDFRNVTMAQIKGNFDSKSKVMNLQSTVKGLQYQNYSLANMNFQAKSNINSLSLNTSVDSIFQKDSLVITPFVLTGNYKDKKMTFNMRLQQQTASSRLNVSGMIQKMDNGFSLKLLPSEIFVNGKKWNIDQRNLISYKDKVLSVAYFTIFHHQEAIKLYTSSSRQNIALEIKRIDLHDVLSNLIQKGNNYYGLINGKIEIRNFLTNPIPMVNLDMKQVIINKDTIGNVLVNSSWDPESKKVNVQTSIVGKYQNIGIKGYYKVDEDDPDPIDLDISINRFTPNFLDNFITEYMYDSRGDFSGKLKLKGTIKKPLLTGFVNINRFETTVNTIHTRYRLKNQIARFSEKGISFDGIMIQDRFNNIAYGGGMIYHQYLTNFFLDIYIKTKKFECLNTNYSQNKVFWGSIFGDAKYTMYGATDGIIDMKLSGKAIEGSDLTLLLGDEKELEKYTFYTFREKNTKKEEKEKKRSLFVKKSGVNIELDVEVTTPCKLHIIFDPLAEDRINAEGTGNIKLKVKKNGEFNIVGDYKVDHGDYLFTFQNAIKRKFYLKSGGSMTFIGDPLQSQINVDAVLRTRASPYDLVATYIDQSDVEIINAAKIQTPLDLNLKLRNNLIKPDISFDISFLSYDNKLKTAFDNLVQSMRNNENELNRQVFGILVLNRFMPPIYSPFPNNNLNSKDFQNTVTEYLANQLSNYVSDWLTNFITDVNFGLKYREYNQSGLTSPELRRELQLSLTKKFANNRLIVNVGGNFDFGQQNQNNTNRNFAGGDLELEYILTKDGNVRIKAFSKGQYDAFNSRSINRTGAGISYRQEFNDANEFKQIIFKKK